MFNKKTQHILKPDNLVPSTMKAVKLSREDLQYFFCMNSEDHENWLEILEMTGVGKL